jgi:hypothetical protein
MGGLQVNVHVDARAAITAGKTRVGSQGFTVSEEELAVLPLAERLELALAYEANEVIGTTPGEPVIVEPTLEAVKPVLARRAAKRAEVEAERARVEVRQKEEAAVTARTATDRNNARSRALRAWVDKHGDDNQKARMAEGFLPEAEILEDVCDELLELTGFSAYDPLNRGHACECACAGDVVMSVRAPQYLDDRQFSRLQAAREDAPEGAVVTVHEHKAACPSCPCVPIARLEVRLTMEWHGFELVRQYKLD